MFGNYIKAGFDPEKEEARKIAALPAFEEEEEMAEGEAEGMDEFEVTAEAELGEDEEEE